MRNGVTSIIYSYQPTNPSNPTDQKDGNAAVTGQAVTQPVTSKTEPPLIYHETSKTRQISLFPWTNSWRRDCHAETTPIGKIDHQKNYATTNNFDTKTEKPL